MVKSVKWSSKIRQVSSAKSVGLQNVDLEVPLI